jgi:hypothetical protein
MKTWIAIFLLSLSVWAQKPTEIFSKIENAQYHPKFKNLQDLVFDMYYPLLMRQLNEKSFLGRVTNLSFRFYWTRDPERIDIEVLGLPEGFIEIKNQLKQAALIKLEDVLPLSYDKKFKGYISSTAAGKPNVLILKDQSLMQPIPEFRMHYKPSGQLSLIQMMKPVGVAQVQFEQMQKDWSAGRWVTTKTNMSSSENGYKADIQKEFQYVTVKGIGFPSTVKTRTTLTALMAKGAKPQVTIDEVTFKNYRVNEGKALRRFIAQ